jgi:hypothetical protein
MSPAMRKLALTCHVTTSVGWVGAVAVFIALALAGVTSRDGRTVQAAYVAMALSGWFVIVPLCVASLITGIVQAFGTPWGLLRHYWVIVKLIITAVATIVLLLHMDPITRVAEAAVATPALLDGMQRVRVQVLIDAGAALGALLLATTLSVYKPRGTTTFARRW